MAKDLLRIATAGSVDDGKSTLIGRLLYDSGGIYEDQLKAVSKASRNGLELALLTDGLRSEREQGITIDVAYRYFSTPQRKFIIADTPGHEQYTRNMATGASTADVALILVDARKGILPQTSRHASIAWLLGIREVVVVVNKMDLVEMRQEVFNDIRTSFARVQAAMPGTHVHFIPAVATDGDNIARRSERIGWFDGPCVLEYLESLSVEQSMDTRFRMAVQYVIRAEDYRGYTGQIASGSVRVGDELVALPSGKTVKVAGLPSFDGDETEASVPMSVSIRLEEHLDLGRGDILAHPDQAPTMTRLFSARMVWMSEEPLQPHHRYQFKHLSQTVYGEIKDVRSRLYVVNLAEQPAELLRLNDIGIVTIETHLPIFCDRYRENRQTGSFVVIDPISNLTVGAGMVEAVADRQDVVPRRVSAKSGLTAWFTGLSSAGKSTLSRAVYEQLVARGHRVELLDGDEVRKHLSRGLGFSREDRDENIRRIGFVAEKLTRHGVIVLVSAISPYREIRDEMRERIASFLEVYVNAPIAVCEERDVKGLYRKARSGGLPRFTGVDDPYEPPLAPEVECHTDREDISQSSAKIVAAIEAALHAPVGGGSGN